MSELKQDQTPQIKFQEILKKPANVWDPYPLTVQKAFDRICKLWNKDSKSRGFLKHLIIAHMPVDQGKRLISIEKGKYPKCAILGFELNGIKNIAEGFAEFSSKKLFITVKATAESRKPTKDEINEIKKLHSQYHKSILYGSVAYASQETDKYLSLESIMALHYFTSEMILISNDIAEIINIKRLKEKGDEIPKAKQKLTKAKQLTQKLEDCVGGNDLLALKLKMEDTDNE